MKKLFNLAGILFFVGAFLFGVSVLQTYQKKEALTSSVSAIGAKNIFTETVLFQGSDPLTQKMILLIQKMRTILPEEDGDRVAVTKNAGYLTFNEDLENIYFSLQSENNIISLKIPKLLTYMSGTYQVLDEEEKPLTPEVLSIILNQELLE